MMHLPAVRRLRGSTGSTASSLPGTPSSASLPALYRFRTYDLLISLWLTASALYRELEQFDEANGAIHEAERLAELLAKMDVSVKTAPGRLFRDHNLAAALQERARGKAKLGSSKAKPRDGEGYIAKWGPVDLGVRRVLADIAFEVSCPEAHDEMMILTSCDHFYSPDWCAMPCINSKQRSNQ